MLVQMETNTIREYNFSLRKAKIEDLTAIVDLLNTCAIDQTGMPDTNRNQILSDWTGPTFDLDTAVRVAETPDGTLVGYIEVWDIDPMPVSNWVWGRVHPGFEGQGIGTAMMNWAEERLQQA